ncbi:MAG TPA: hypothetical protein VMT85_25385 [Thermoanaerobaculia bacterium]|nr:hypothetical protein [Thermoanaerobaculia bacterium]
MNLSNNSQTEPQERASRFDILDMIERLNPKYRIAVAHGAKAPFAAPNPHEELGTNSRASWFSLEKAEAQRVAAATRHGPTRRHPLIDLAPAGVDFARALRDAGHCTA